MWEAIQAPQLKGPIRRGYYSLRGRPRPGRRGSVAVFERTCDSITRKRLAEKKQWPDNRPCSVQELSVTLISLQDSRSLYRSVGYSQSVRHDFELLYVLKVAIVRDDWFIEQKPVSGDD